MAEVHAAARSEEPSKSVSRAAWGLLMVWTGVVLLLSWGWGVGFLGAGALVLGAQVVRRYLRLEVEGFALFVGSLLVICGAASLFQVPVDLFPVVCILAGIALLGSAWTARARHAHGGRAELQANSRPPA